MASHNQPPPMTSTLKERIDKDVWDKLYRRASVNSFQIASKKMGDAFKIMGAAATAANEKIRRHITAGLREGRMQSV